MSAMSIWHPQANDRAFRSDKLASFVVGVLLPAGLIFIVWCVRAP